MKKMGLLVAHLSYRVQKEDLVHLRMFSLQRSHSSTFCGTFGNSGLKTAVSQCVSFKIVTS